MLKEFKCWRLIETVTFTCCLPGLFQFYSEDLVWFLAQPSGNLIDGALKLHFTTLYIYIFFFFCFTSFPVSQVLLDCRSGICRNKFYSCLLSLHYRSILAPCGSTLSSDFHLSCVLTSLISPEGELCAELWSGFRDRVSSPEFPRDKTNLLSHLMLQVMYFGLWSKLQVLKGRRRDLSFFKEKHST